MRGRRARAERGPDAWASVSPKGQVLAAVAVLVPVALSGLALVALAPGLWWILMTYFWVSFPALRLLARGLTGLSGGLPSADDRGEREILEALREHDELTPARAALETSLTVAEADGILESLAKGGHLEVRARGGTLSYTLWEARDGGVPRRGIGRPSGPGFELLGSGEDAQGQSPKRSAI